MLSNEEKNRVKVQVAAIKQENEGIDKILGSNPSKEELESFLRDMRARNNEKLEKRIKRLEKSEIQCEIREYEKALGSNISDSEKKNFEVKLDLALNRLKFL